MRIGILGGTFDPVHNGHIALARRAMRRNKLDRVIFVPAFIPPHKCPPEVSALNRLRMLRIALKGKPYFSVSEIELKTRRRTFTVNTLKKLRRRYRELFFLVGSDEFKELDKWKDIKTAMRLAHFVSGKRTPISGTEIRRRVKAGLPIDEMVPPAVKEYILRRGLYKSQKKGSESFFCKDTAQKMTLTPFSSQSTVHGP